MTEIPRVVEYGGESCGFIVFMVDSGSAAIPANDEGRAWIKRANEIMSMKDNASTAALWDEHSLYLEKIGGRWR